MKASYPDTTDQFCGAGGTAQGVAAAGVEIKTALNHWPRAVETYSHNFKDTKVYCADVSAADPRWYPSTMFMHASPECTVHSPAGGNHYRAFKKQMAMFEKGEMDPAADRSRMTMWDVVRFTEFHNYEFIIVENVVEAKTRWPLFDTWLLAMKNLGYDHKCCFLNSMHFLPTPQSRDRMYVVFWKKGNPKPDLEYTPDAHCPCCSKNVKAIQWWKNSDKNYGKYRQQYLYRCPECTEVVEPYYYASFNIIDWNIPGVSVLDRPKPLAEATIKRIEFGLEKHGHEYMIIGHRFGTDLKTNIKSMMEDPIPTQTSSHNHGAVMPFFVQLDHSKGKPAHHVRGGSDPTKTMTTADSNAVVMPFIIEMNRTGKARPLYNAISTVLAGGNHHAILQAPFIVENNGQSTARSSTKPFPTQTAEPKHGIVGSNAIQAFLTYYYGNMNVPTKMSDVPGTVTTKDRMSLTINKTLVGKKPTLEDCTYRTLRPHEIQRAMAFEDEYVVLGNSREKVRQLGNGVTPPVQTWLTKQCLDTLN